MLRLALDAITGFSLKPLKFATYLGLTVSALSFILMIRFVILKLLGGPQLVPGWTSLFVAMCFLGGVQLLTVGIVGEYVGRIYEEVKGRPLYLVREADGFDQSTPKRKQSP